MPATRATLSRIAAAGLAFVAAACASAPARPNYDEFVWPAPPDKPRLQLEDVLLGRADVLAKSGLQRKLLGSAPAGPYDWLSKPFAVEFDQQGRVLVSDSALGAVFRFDRATRRADVFGTRGAVALKNPLGLALGPDNTLYVADVGLHKVVAFDADGKLRAVYGHEGELTNPTDAAVSPDGTRLFVADSKEHRIVVFDLKSGERQSAFGKHGTGDGEFGFPTSLAFDQDGNLLVIDQINARVQVLTDEGRFVQKFGSLGVGFANFVRPKDVAVDELGLVYVTDAAFGNVQIFAPDYRLLTFVGSTGEGPGQFQIATGVAVRGERMAVVDQLGRRVQIFRYVAPKDAP